MKYALIIGSNQYDDPKLAQLKTPAADSQALAKVLDDKTIGGFDEVTPLINQTETVVRRAVSGFLTNKKPDDLVLVYFSGHGVLDDRGRLYLALKDTLVSLLKATSIPSSFLADEMDSCRSKRQILILDCCHSGAFERGTKGEQKAITETTFEGSGFGRVVLTASDSTQYALEGDQVIKQTELSLFTHFLLEGLKTGEADTNNDGQVSLDEWYDYTYGRVISETPRQVPHKWSYNQRGDLVIAKNPFVKKKIVELPYELMQALDSPFVGIRESAVIELGKYLKSREPGMAELVFMALQRMKNDDSRRISSLAEKLLLEYEQAHRPAPEAAPPEPPTPVKVEPVQVTSVETTPPPPVTTKADIVAEKQIPERKVEKLAAVVDQPSAPQELVFDRTFWLKWIGVTGLGTFLSLTLVNSLSNNGWVSAPSILMAIGTGIGSLLQWFAFRGHLRIWWPGIHAFIGFLLGSLHDYLYSNSGWGDRHGVFLLVYWIIGSVTFGRYLMRSAQEKEKQKTVLLESGVRQDRFLRWLGVTLILVAICNFILVLGLDYGVQRAFWGLYGLAVLLVGASFTRDLPRNPGFIALVIFLLLDGLNIVLLTFNSSYPVFYFVLSGIPALVSGIYFISQRETWRNIGFLLLAGYLIANGLASLATPTVEVSHPLLVIASMFAIPTAFFFFSRK